MAPHYIKFINVPETLQGNTITHVNVYNGDYPGVGTIFAEVDDKRTATFTDQGDYVYDHNWYGTFLVFYLNNGNENDNRLHKFYIHDIPEYAEDELNASPHETYIIDLNYPMINGQTLIQSSLNNDLPDANNAKTTDKNFSWDVVVMEDSIDPDNRDDPNNNYNQSWVSDIVHVKISNIDTTLFAHDVNVLTFTIIDNNSSSLLRHPSTYLQYTDVGNLRTFEGTVGYSKNVDSLTVPYTISFHVGDGNGNTTDLHVNTNGSDFIYDGTGDFEIDISYTGQDGSNNHLVTCFPSDTPIQTDKGLKKISELKRGDLVQTLNGLKPLARLMKTGHTKNHTWVRFPAGCLGNNVPSNDLLCTKPHPLVRNHKLCGATNFVGKVQGVEYVVKRDDTFNLLFEDQEYLLINGVCVVSHHPHHPDKPLRKEEYFNQMKYRPGLFTEHVVSFEEWCA